VDRVVPDAPLRVTEEFMNEHAIDFVGHGTDNPESERRVHVQVRVATQVLRMLHAGVLLLDEVDLVLHPLKSELNWPLGNPEPLDFLVNLNPNR